MKLFDIKDNKIVVTPEVLEIPEFKEIWDKDKDKRKNNAFNDFKYIKYSCDHDSPYSSVSHDKQEAIILTDVYGNSKYKISEDVKVAMTKYLFLIQTPLQRLVLATRGKIDDFATFLSETTITPENHKAISETMDRISKVVATLDKVEEAVNKEKLNSNERRRAGKKTNKYED